MMRLLHPQHVFWSVGFRPFFLAAIMMGVFLPTIWAMVFAGYLKLPTSINPLQWHVHEMLFGFGGSVLIGFLLTASKNWVKVRGIHGYWLMLLFALWICERIFFIFLYDEAFWIQHLLMSLFFVVSGLYVATTLVRHRLQDSYRDNYLFLLLLLVILIGKNLLISPQYYVYGLGLSVGMFRLAFVVMFERTMTQFMRNTEGLVLYSHSTLNASIRFFAVLAAFESFFPSTWAAALLLVFAATLLFRWIKWQPLVGFKKFGNATMYLGYLALVAHLVLLSFKRAQIWSYGTTDLHTFTFLCMGIVIASMMVRICQGHTGRKPEFLFLDRVAVSLIFLAGVVRLVLPLIWSEFYFTWVVVSGLLWSTGFLLLAYRFFPYLFQPRVS